jgi:transposase
VAVSKTFRPYQPDQLLALPPSLHEWLPTDHLVYFVSDLVESLDLSAIYSSYTEERGFPPYHPLLMTKLWVYAYARGLRSSRKVERATREDVAFRILCAGNEPDFRTLAAFRKRHLATIRDLFLQVLQLCRRAGLAKLDHVALDGTKVKANASKHKAMSYARMIDEDARLRAEVEKMLAESDAIDAAEDAQYGADKRGDELPAELANRKTRLKKIQEAKAALEAEVRAKREASGRGKSTPSPKAQRNFTDPDSRIMLNSDKAYVQAYNAQLAVDADHQIIVAADVVQASNDKQQLIPMVEALVDNCEETPGAVSADAGFWSEANAQRMEYYEIDAFIAPERINRKEWREATVPPEPLPDDATRKEKMRYKLRTTEGRAEYDKRKITVEPVCGQLKTVQGITHFLLRGLTSVQGEWLLACMAHNVLKLHRAVHRLEGVVSPKAILAGV